MLKSEMLSDVHEFLENASYTDQTRKSYGYLLKRLADWLAACCLSPADLTPTLLRRYLDEQRWGSNLRRLALSSAKAFVRWRYGSAHPILAVPLPKDTAGPQRSLDMDQVDQLLQSIDLARPVGRRNLALLSLALESGLRSSEICGLRLEHLDLAQRHFYALAKGRVWREGVFSSYTGACLENWLYYRPEIALQGVRTVFVSCWGLTPGKPLTPAGLRAVFRNMGKHAGIGPLSPHDLRRTMACLYTEAGMPSRKVQLLGAWTDIRMVTRYTRSLKLLAGDVDKYSPVIASLQR